METKDILQQIASKKVKPIYFLHGEEAYFLDELVVRFEQDLLDESQKSFDFSVFYGKDSDAKSILDTCMRLPLMSPFQLVIVKEAQHLKDIKSLETYVKSSNPSTVLVLVHKYKKYPMRDAFAKALQKEAVIFEGKKLYDNKVGAWIMEYAKGKGHAISPDQAEMLKENLGGELDKIANELQKLFLNVPKGAKITAELIETYIGISKDYNVFEYQKALGYRDVKKCILMAHYFGENTTKNPIQMALGSLYQYFTKVLLYQEVRNASESEQLKAIGLNSPFFLREYRDVAVHYPVGKLFEVFDILHEYDLKSKGVGFNSTLASDNALYLELTWKILNT